MMNLNNTTNYTYIVIVNVRIVNDDYQVCKLNVGDNISDIEKMKNIYNESGRELYIILHKLDSRKLSVFEVNGIKILDGKKEKRPKGYSLLYKDNITEIYNYNSLPPR